jgi:mgtE-like transporter
MLFAAFGLLSLAVNGIFSYQAIISLLILLAISNIISFVAIALLSYSISILTFKKGLDPDNFVIPVESSLADAITTAALFAALLILTVSAA